MHNHALNALLITIVISSAATSCEKETTIQNAPQQTTADSYKVNEEGEYVIRERDPRFPFTDYGDDFILPALTKADPGIDSYLGYSMRTDDYPFESQRNLGYPVFDFERYRSDHPGYYTNIPIHDGESSSIAFAGYERYEEKTQNSKTVNAGFNINLGLFKIKAKYSYKKVFNESEASTSQYVYGEYTHKYFDREYKIMIPEASWDELYQSYVHRDFLHSLYNLSPSTLIKNYGGFVITDYITGAQAKVLYRGTVSENNHSSSSQKEKEFEASIDGSVKKVNGDANGGFMVGDGRSSTFNGKYSNVQVSARTLGGTPVFTSFSYPNNIESISFDFTPWCNSLSDQSKLCIVELPNNSLVPITAFIEEDNIREAIVKYYETGTTNITKLNQPYIFIFSKYYSMDNAYVVQTSLKTRYGQGIDLYQAKIEPDEIVEYYNTIQERISSLEIISNIDITDPDFYKGPSFIINAYPGMVESFIVMKGKQYLIRMASMAPGIIMNDYMREEAARIRKMYPNSTIKIEDSGYGTHEAGLSMEEIPNLVILVDVDPRSIDPDYFDSNVENKEKNLLDPKKYVDTISGKTYLLTVNPSGEKVAYTLYDDNIIRDYCMNEYIDSLPEVKDINLGYIRRNYKMIAL